MVDFAMIYSIMEDSVGRIRIGWEAEGSYSVKGA